MANKYHIVNETEHPQREVRKLITYAGRELDLGHVTVYVKYSHAREGCAHGYANHGGRSVVIFVPSKRSYAAPAWRMHLLSLAAHELRHAEDYQRGGLPAWYGELTGAKDKRGRHIRERKTGIEREKRARAYAQYIVNKWKEEHGTLTEKAA